MTPLPPANLPLKPLLFFSIASLATLSSCGLTGLGGGGDCKGGKCDELECNTPGVALSSVFPGTTVKYPVSVKQTADKDDPRFYIVEKAGSIVAIEPDGGDVRKKPLSVNKVLDLETTCKFPEEGTCTYRQDNGELGWEEGMLDVVFHPEFPDTPFAYVTYIAGRGDTMIWRLSRFTATGGKNFVLDQGSEEIMIAERKPEDTHNGGSLAFGPDGMLYASVGDGGGVLSEQPQNVNTIFGSILRLDVDKDCDRGYRIPADNPFAAQDRGADGCDLSGEGGRPEIYAWGIRNPWRLSFDRETGELWEAEVGQDSREEVNIIEKGKNYGYPMLEANLVTPKNVPGLCTNGCQSLAAPEIEIWHEGQAGTPPDAVVGNSVTGGYVYRPTDRVSEEIEGLEGHYIFGDFMTTELWAYNKDSDEPAFVVAKTGKRLAAFGEDRDGNLFVLDHQVAGGMYMLTSGPCQSVNRPDNFYSFLSRDGINSKEEAFSYYTELGLDPLTYDLEEWQKEHFDTFVSDCFGDNQPSACDNIIKSYYKNDMDLGFWREMYCSKSIGRGQGGCMVRNWTDEDDLKLEGTGASNKNLGTVAMSVSPEGFTRFYAFGPDGRISPVAVLDSEGEKSVPNLCTPCHGGTRWVPGSESADLGSIFREFEPSLFGLRDGLTAEFPPTDRETYEKEMFLLNQAALSANRSLRSEADGSPADFDKWKKGVIDYIENDLYASEDPAKPISRPVTDPHHIPDSWATGGSVAQIEAKEELWMNVVHPFCMGCHRTNTKDFTEYSNFVGLAAVQGNQSLLEAYTSGEKNDPKRALSFMPQAELMFDNFVTGQAGELQVDVAQSVRRWLQQVINPSGPVCDINFTVFAPTKPGQDVFIAGEIGTFGEWEPQTGLPLDWQRCTDNSCNLSEWKGSATVLRGSRVEFKPTMVQFNTGGPPTVVWEEAAGGNRVMDVPNNGAPVCNLDINITFNQP